MLVVGLLLGFLGALAVMVPAVVVLDRRAEARDRVRARVDQVPMPMPGAFERPRERVLTSARAAPVFDGTPE